MDWLDWILLVARVVVVFFALLITVMLLIWLERKVAADMQTRMGPMRAGPRGVLITLADGIKLFFKEGITPTLADRPVYLLAPVIAMIPAFLAFAVIPFGTGVTLFGRRVPFQIADPDVGILWVLAMGSLMVYGIVLAGWSSGSNYPLLGSIRSTAQMISYEVGMGLALVAVLLYSGSLQLSEIVASQDRVWNAIPQFPAFAIYLIAGLAETNRPPVSSIAVTLFLGGWRGPHPAFLAWLWPLLWFIVKVVAIVYLYFWVRLTLPRIRYDRLMSFGWKFLIPFGLLWVLATAAVVVLPDVYGRGTLFTGALIVAGAVVVVLLVWPLVAPGRRPVEETPP
jgi:NADH-quinone oxidoreductase subunit H